MTGRPQRTLTEDELDMIRDWPALCLHRALLQGLVDPAPNPSPMTEEDASWVREHAWQAHHREIESGYPFGWHRYGYCERGSCWNCLAKRCDLCVHRQQGGPSRDDGRSWVYNHRGRPVSTLLRLPKGGECVWWCRCPCPKTGPLATETTTAPAPAGPLCPTRKPRGRPATELLPDTLF
ncbi:DUF6248 family natural product biosynthesis protein [Nocardiopsis terrae]|uniref:DUF6248 family natural product biosynthesis protein n=1 Tax=Streptomyces sp. NPDC057554 TaxID=3350538 RepID=UPI0036A2B12E